jgi:hypothetical protein
MRRLWFQLMPSPNRIASNLARPTRETALVVLDSSLALYDPMAKPREVVR